MGSKTISSAATNSFCAVSLDITWDLGLETASQALSKRSPQHPKSTHAEQLRRWLRSLGTPCRVQKLLRLLGLRNLGLHNGPQFAKGSSKQSVVSVVIVSVCLALSQKNKKTVGGSQLRNSLLGSTPCGCISWFLVLGNSADMVLE